MAQKKPGGKNIYLRKDGRWEGRRKTGTKNGRTVYVYIYARSYDEALNKLETVARRQETDEALHDQQSFLCIANEWLMLQKTRLKPASISSYTNIINSYLVPRFGSRHIPDINRAEFTALACDLLEHGGTMGQGLSASTVNTILTVAKNILLYASREKELSVADIRGIPVKQIKTDPPTLSEKDQETLVQWLYDNLTPCNLGILLSLYTGIRLGEICALRWKDISRDDQSVAVYQTMQRIQRPGEKRTEVVVQAPKSPSAFRRVPVSKEMAKLLAENRKADEAYLLTGDQMHFMEPRSLQRQFKRALRACGMKDVNFHTLRHTFATRGIEVGFDPKTLSAILGHATVSMTLNRYVHPSMEQKQRNMNLFPELLTVNQSRQSRQIQPSENV